MKRKILVTLLAFCLIATLCVVGAAAREPVSTGNSEENCTDENCNHVAAIGTTHYDDLEYAISQATSGQTIDILCNVDDGRGVVIRNTNNITIDFHDYTYTVTKELAGSNGSETQCFQIHKDAKITMKNGTIVANNPSIVMIIQNYCDLTLEDMTLDATKGTNKVSYVLSNNCGDVVITGDTDIIAEDGQKAFDAYYWPSNTYTEGVTVTIDKNFTGTITGDIEATRDTSTTSTGNSTINIEAGTVNGDITCASNGKVSISNATVNGDIKNTSTVGGELVIDNAKINGTVANSNNSATTTVTGSTVTGAVTGAVVIDSTVAGVPTDSAPEGVVAVVGGKHYTDLETALEETGTEPVTIELVANANMVASNTDYIVSKRDTVINGNGHTINITVDPNDKFDSTRDKMLQFDGATLTLNNVTLNITGQNDGDGTYSGDAIDLIGGAHLYANDSFINIQNVGAGFVIETVGEDIVLNNTDVTVKNVNGNGSQGGEWTVNGSSLSFTNCGDHGLSVETLVATNSLINVDDADKLALFGSIIDLNSTEVNVTNSGFDLPVTNGYAETLGGYYSPVQVKGIATEYYLSIDAGSSITVTDSHNGNNTVYLPDGAELINNGTINATVTVPEDSDMNVVLFMADGRQYDVQVVNDGDSVRMPTLSKSGYTFTGWRVNSSNTIVKGGESYPITANTTFTAVWNMIMIPDTYDIAVDQPAHGTVDVSFSNASQGSVITVTATPDEGYELVYITVDGEPISGSSFVMPDHAVEVSALFAEIGKEVNFVDVSRADWFYDYVQYVAQNGLMEGTTRTAFEPNASMTRAMFWTVLARIDGETITGDAWKTLAQTWAVESGISDGTNADALITREQMVTMLYRYAGSPVTGGMAISEFTDSASVSDYATDAVTWALSEGILTGMGDGILAPQGTATRAQAAAMLMRFVEA